MWHKLKTTIYEKSFLWLRRTFQAAKDPLFIQIFTGWNFFRIFPPIIKLSQKIRAVGLQSENSVGDGNDGKWNFTERRKHTRGRSGRFRHRFRHDALQGRPHGEPIRKNWISLSLYFRLRTEKHLTTSGRTCPMHFRALSTRTFRTILCCLAHNLDNFMVREPCIIARCRQNYSSTF